MKIALNKVRPVPKYAPKSSDVITVEDFSVGVFGDPDQEVKDWIAHHGFQIYTEGKYTNIIIPDGFKLEELFTLETGPVFEYMDGFSPNLNKYLHIGHFSNLVLCKAFVGLGICKNTISIYGDTLTSEVGQKNAVRKLREYQEKFEFRPDQEFYASRVKYEGDLLVPGSGKNEGAQVFKIDGAEFVGIKVFKRRWQYNILLSRCCISIEIKRIYIVSYRQ
jgi:hypothetical protein